MIPIGNKIGTALTKSKKLSMILIFSFALGFAVTVSRTRSSGPRGNGAPHKQRRSSHNGRHRRRALPYHMYGENPYGYKAPMAAHRFLCAPFRLSVFHRRRLPEHSFRLGRSYNRSYDGAFHFGLRSGYFQHTKRQEGGGRQLRSGVPLLHRTHIGRPDSGLLLFGQRGRRRGQPVFIRYNRRNRAGICSCSS